MVVYRMEMKWHFLVASLTSPIVLALTESYFAVVLWFLLGVFVDADHEVDYFMREKKITFNVKEILNPPPVFLPLHCLEWIPLAFLLFYIFLPQHVIVPSIYAVHLMMDAFYLREKPLFYFGIYRLLKWIKKVNI